MQEQYKLVKFQVHNFRNIQSGPLDLNEGLNCISGNNGNGKTNLLEAIFYLVKKKSFRKKVTFPQIMSMNGDSSEILFSAVLKQGEKLRPCSGKISSEGQQWFFDGSPKKNLGISVLFFNPFDSFRFYQEPSFRRQWFDNHLSELNETFKILNRDYQKALRFKNSLLSKKPQDWRKQLDAIDQKLAPLILRLNQEKQDFLHQLNPYLAPCFQQIFSERHDLELRFLPSLRGKSVDDLINAMLLSRAKEEVLGHSLEGSHRDDFQLFFDGLKAGEYCSLGQQKMSYFSLLFAYIELFRYKFKTFPIVLIDDISGELDRTRWEKLIRYLEECRFQVFITTANENFENELDKIKHRKKFSVEDGLVKHH